MLCLHFYVGTYLSYTALGFSNNPYIYFKYRSLTDRYQFEAVAIETAGTYSEGTKNIVRDIGRRLTEATGDQRETFWFMQRLSLAVQRGNAASILCGEKERQRFFGS